MRGDATGVEEIAAAFDPFDPALEDVDVHPLLGRLRDECPIARSNVAGGFFIVSRYADVLHVLQHPELFSSRTANFPFVETGMIPLNVDPPEHRRFRQLLAPLFGPVRVRELEPMIRRTARDLIEPLLHVGECEVVSQVAQPLVGSVFLEHFGLPSRLLPAMTEYSIAVQGDSTRPETRERVRAARRAVRAAYEEALAAAHRDGGAGRGVVPVLAHHVRSGAISEAECLNMLELLTSASLDTTATALANMLTWLASHPDEQEQLRAAPELTPDAVEELLRYDQITPNARVVVRPTALGGVPLAPGDNLLLMHPATGRDPDAYDAPDDVDFRRTVQRHLAFGAGPHRCLGSHLARLVLVVALEEWHATVPGYRPLPGAGPRIRFGILRGVVESHLELSRTG
jgi:cytochrome P450